MWMFYLNVRIFVVVLERIAVIICNFEYRVFNTLSNDEEYGRKIVARLTSMGFTI